MGEDIKVTEVAWEPRGEELRYRCNGVAPVVLLGIQGPGLECGAAVCLVVPRSPKA